MSLKLRLTILYSAILALALAFFGVFLYFYMQHNLMQEIDKSLSSKAVEVFNSIKIIDTYPYPLQKVILPDVDIFTAAPDIYVQVVDKEGHPVARSSNLGQQRLPYQGLTSRLPLRQNYFFETYSFKKGTLRIYNLPLYLDENLVGVLQVGRSLNPTMQALHNLRLLLFFGGILALLIAASAGWLLAHSALQPIERITQEAKSIGAQQDLQRRVPYDGPPNEIGLLASTFNGMLARLQLAYQRLEESYTAQRRFVADASHELRTPLTTIRGNVELLQKMGEQEPEVRAEALQDIKSEAERMSRLINDLLALARADAGQIPEQEPVCLTPLLQEICRQAKVLKGNISFEHDDPENLAGLSILGNADYLKQLFLILLDNAFKYTPDQGKVTFSFHVKGKAVTFQVRDTGIGICPEDLPQIFQRFYRANKNREGSGTGLGLSIAKWIVEIHGGEIKVESTPGQGSTFFVTFFNIF